MRKALTYSWSLVSEAWPGASRSQRVLHRLAQLVVLLALAWSAWSDQPVLALGLLAFWTLLLLRAAQQREQQREEEAEERSRALEKRLAAEAYVRFLEWDFSRPWPGKHSSWQVEARIEVVNNSERTLVLGFKAFCNCKGQVVSCALGDGSAIDPGLSLVWRDRNEHRKVVVQSGQALQCELRGTLRLLPGESSERPEFEFLRVTDHSRLRTRSASMHQLLARIDLSQAAG